MNDPSVPPRRTTRLLREPLVHFFALGAMLFVGERLLKDEPRSIMVTSGVKADLERRFTDAHGRPPSPQERVDTLAAWKREEALYREALRRDLDRNDATIRGVLVDKMRSEAALEISMPEPSDAELDRFLQEHRERYERSRRYDFQFLTFSKADAHAEEQRARVLSSLEAGARPSELGRPLRGAKLAAEDMPERIPMALAQRIVQLAPDSWARAEGEAELWLVRVRGISGGLPELKDIRKLVAADFKAAAEEEAVRRELQKTVDLYRFEETDGAR